MKRAPHWLARWYADVIFYHGEERDIDLSALKDAWAAILVSIGSTEPRAEYALQAENGRLTAWAKRGETDLAVSVPLAPQRRKAWEGHAQINGQDLDALYGQKS